MKADNIFRFSVLGLFAIWFIKNYPAFKPIPEVTVWVMEKILNFIHIPTVPYGNLFVVTINGVNRIFNLSGECAGIILFTVFLFGTFIIPDFKIRDRLISLLFLPLIFLGNTLRILIDIIIANKFSLASSTFFHDTIGQAIIFGIAIWSYIAWLKATGNFPKDKNYKSVNKNSAK